MVEDKSEVLGDLKKCFAIGNVCGVWRGMIL